MFRRQTTESDIVQSGQGQINHAVETEHLEESARASWRRWQKGGFLGGKMNQKLIVCELWPKQSQTPPLQRGTTQTMH